MNEKRRMFYASIDAHLALPMSRRDDIWSFFFIMLESFGQPLNWSMARNSDEVLQLKLIAIKDPIGLLFPKLHV